MPASGAEAESCVTSTTDPCCMGAATIDSDRLAQAIAKQLVMTATTTGGLGARRVPERRKEFLARERDQLIRSLSSRRRQSLSGHRSSDQPGFKDLEEIP